MQISKINMEEEIHKLSVRSKSNVVLFMKNDFVSTYKEFTDKNTRTISRQQSVDSNLMEIQHRNAMLDDISTISSIKNKEELDINNIGFSLSKNGDSVQEGNSKDMLFNFDKIIAYISQFYTLKIGDLIYTGTPAGVGQVANGDVLEGFISTQKMFVVKVR